jgi:hypothetical protein
MILASVFDHIPGLGGIVKAIAEAPWLLLKAWLGGFFDGLNDSLLRMIAHPLQVGDGPWKNYLYANSLGLAQWASEVFFIFVLCGAVIYHKWVPHLKRAFWFMLAVFIVPAFYYWGWGEITAWRDTLAKGAEGIYHAASHTGGHPLLWIPTVSNIPGAILGYLSTLIPAFFLYWLFVLYGLIVVACTFLILPLAALSVFGEWARRLLNIFIALGFVAGLAGIPIGILFVNLGRTIASDSAIAHYALPTTIIVAGGWWAALLMQGVLFWAALKATSYVTGNILGSVTSRSTVDGSVDVEQKRTWEVENRDASYANSFMYGGAEAEPVVATIQGSHDDHQNRERARQAAVMMVEVAAPEAAPLVGAANATASSQSDDTVPFHQNGGPVGPSATGPVRMHESGLPHFDQSDS